MRKLFLPLIVGLILLTSTSCTIFTSKGKVAIAEEKSRTRIVNVEGQIVANTTEKLNEIAGLAYGTDYALSKVNNPPREVSVARDINQRVTSLAGSPTIERMKEMQETIDKLVSILATERNEGKIKLDGKDAQISAIQLESKLLVETKESEIRKYMLTAQEAAANADAYKTELNKMDSWMGLGAVWYGIKKFIISSMWILGIGSLLFFVLRIASVSNPVCGAIFSIFEQMVAWIIRSISYIFPKALTFAGHVSSSLYSSSQLLLQKIIDNIQNLKQIEQKMGHEITLKELFVELDKSMDVAEKKAIAEIKSKLGY
jgi:hypothetical protein